MDSLPAKAGATSSATVITNDAEASSDPASFASASLTLTVTL